MNKKEKSAHYAMANHIQVAASLHITPLVDPDVHFVSVMHDDGWIPNRYSNALVELNRPGRGYPVYSTRLLALKAARNEEELHAGLLLAKIDAAIAAELSSGELK